MRECDDEERHVEVDDPGAQHAAVGARGNYVNPHPDGDNPRPSEAHAVACVPPSESTFAVSKTKIQYILVMPRGMRCRLVAGAPVNSTVSIPYELLSFSFFSPSSSSI